MKKVNAYYLDEELIQEVKRVAKIKDCSEGQIINESVFYYLEHGGPLEHEDTTHRIKSIRLKIQEEDFKKALKTMHNKSFVEIGDRCDEH